MWTSEGLVSLHHSLPQPITKLFISPLSPATANINNTVYHLANPKGIPAMSHQYWTYNTTSVTVQNSSHTLSLRVRRRSRSICRMSVIGTMSTSEPSGSCHSSSSTLVKTLSLVNTSTLSTPGNTRGTHTYNWFTPGNTSIGLVPDCADSSLGLDSI